MYVSWPVRASCYCNAHTFPPQASANFKNREGQRIKEIKEDSRFSRFSHGLVLRGQGQWATMLIRPGLSCPSKANAWLEANHILFETVETRSLSSAPRIKPGSSSLTMPKVSPRASSSTSLDELIFVVRPHEAREYEPGPLLWTVRYKVRSGSVLAIV